MGRRNRKKRNKAYTGADAAMTKPVVTRVSAVNRNKLAQWWFDRKRVLKPALITGGVAAVVIWLIIELVRIITN